MPWIVSAQKLLPRFPQMRLTYLHYIKTHSAYLVHLAKFDKMNYAEMNYGNTFLMWVLSPLFRWGRSKTNGRWRMKMELRDNEDPTGLELKYNLGV